MNVLKIAARGSAPSGPPNAWDLAFARLKPISAYAGDVTKAFYTGKSFATSLTGNTGLYFKDDGTKMYICDNGIDGVRQFSLSTAWDVTTASVDSTLSVSAQSSNPRSLYFSPDGTRLYLVDVTNDEIEQYSLSTAWDVSTGSHVRAFSVSAQETSPSGVAFKTDGTKMYVVGQSGDDVNEYDLSTAWDISTASYLQNFSVASQETGPVDIKFSSDGTKMYVGGSSGVDINYYTLSTAWNVTTASFVGSIATGDSGQLAHFVRDDGLYMWTCGSTLDTVRQFVFGDRFTVSTQETNPEGMFFKPDGTKMYIIGRAGDDVNEYDLSTAWLVSSASFVQSFSISAKETDAFGLFFKPDGTEMYITGIVSDSVHQYSLSSAWDVSTASFTRSFSVSAKETAPEDVFFKDDGTKMYIIGSDSDSTHEYTLSTAWDISTASFASTFSVSSQDTTPQGMFIGDGGSKLYVAGDVGDDINEYTLSTPWDISTASYVQNLPVLAFTSPASIYFADGSLFFVLSADGDAVYTFEIS
jgi:DNA-binding beta-propeller fold protein YncE